MKVINAESQAEEKFKNGFTREVKVYKGNAEMNARSSKPDVWGTTTYKVGSGKWKNSEGRFKLWNEIKEFQGKYCVENAATAPTPTELAAYYAKLFIDVQRLQDDMLDITPLICNVIRDDMAPELAYLRDYLPFTGKEKIISGNNDKVPLIEQKTANTAQIQSYIRAFGWKDSLKNLAWNPVPVLQKVTEAAAIIALDSKNNDIASVIVNATYGAKHTIAADSTGSTFDLKVYNTLRKARKVLGALYHPMYTKKLVSSLPQFGASIGIMCHPKNLWDIQRIVSGFTAGGFVQDVSGLPFGDIFAFAGGIMDGETWGEETLSLPGCQEDYAYMFVPGQAHMLIKRDATLETGTGSVLELSTEERSWHSIRGLHTDYLIGGAATNTGKGTIIKVALPTES